MKSNQAISNPANSGVKVFYKKFRSERILKGIIALLAFIVGLYPFLYFLVDRHFGLLQSKPDSLLVNISWNTAFYIHIVFGGLALLIGWIQFSKTYRTRYVSWHRRIGKTYVIFVLLSSTASLYLAFFATAGILASLGFMCLGLFWFQATARAYLLIRKKKVDAHQKMMIYSYAACFAAVTLRIYLPLLIGAFHDFNTAYIIVAWLCWVPNLLIAHFIVRRLERRQVAAM